MITSLVLTGCYNIPINSNKKINVNDQVLSTEKDIPFIRYRFEKYGDEEIAYIKKMKENFNHVTHLAEVKLSENTVETFKRLTDEVGRIARYLYVDITDGDVMNKDLSPEVKSLISDVYNITTELGDSNRYKPDRLMLKDKSSTLDTVAFKSITAAFCRPLKIDPNSVGCCNSPLSFSECACLTAIKARELMTVYSDVADVALPSANHQSMDCCGCIRYLIIDHDTVAVPEPKSKGAKKEKAEVSDSAVSSEDFINGMEVTNIDPSAKTKEPKEKKPKPVKPNKVPIISFI